MAGLITISVAFCLAAVNIWGITPIIAFPGGLDINLGILTTTVNLGGNVIAIPWLYLFFVFLLMAGLSNAVNLRKCSSVGVGVRSFGDMPLHYFEYATHPRRKA